MQLENYEERFFWKKIYHASIKAGKTDFWARESADQAVIYLRDRPVVKKPLPNV